MNSSRFSKETRNDTKEEDDDVVLALQKEQTLNK